MKRQSRHANTTAADLPAMLAIHKPALVIRGGNPIEVDDWDEFKRMYQQGLPVVPGMMVMLDKEGTEIFPPIVTEFEQLVQSGLLRLFMKEFFDWPSADGLGNAHQVAEAIMIDLIVAQRADGWRWIVADVRRPNGPDKHSWMEYRGYAFDAACGKILAWPAWYYRAISEKRNVQERDAEHVCRDLRKTNPELWAVIQQAVAPQRAKVFDFATRQVSEIPLSDLPPGLVCGRVEGIEGPVWVDPTRTTAGADFRHPPFPPKVRQDIERIRKALAEVRPLTTQEWEDGFRRDQNAVRQILVFSCIAEVYSRLTAQTNLSMAQKAEYFRVLLYGSCCDRNSFARTVKVSTISMYEAITAQDQLLTLMQQRFEDEQGAATPVAATT